MTNVKQLKRENLRPYLRTKNERKTKYVNHQQMTTTEIQAPDLGQTHTYRVWLGETCKQDRNPNLISLFLPILCEDIYLSGNNSY